VDCYVPVKPGTTAATAAEGLLTHRDYELGYAWMKFVRDPSPSTLLHRRIEDARAAGCHTLFVETGERTADRPSASYRNILRAGFKEAYLRPNWRRARH
jgi:hypothetical protein